jgi:hypothetical protein
MNPDRSGKTGKISFNLVEARDHTIEIGASRFFRCRSWIPSFFFTIMIILPVFGLVYGIIAFGLKMDPNAYKIPFFAALAVSFIAAFVIIGVPAAFRRIKWDLVVDERGPGNWKIVDSAGWDRFERMVRIGEESEKRRKEEAAREVRKTLGTDR